MEECPLAVGAGFLALGALLGLAMPRTRCEDEFMGEQSDHLKHRAKEMGQDAVERGKHVAEATLQTVKEDVGQEGLTPGTLGQKLQHVAAEALHAAEEAAHEEGIAPSDLADKARHVAKHVRDTAKTEAKHETETIGEQRSV